MKREGEGNGERRAEETKGEKKEEQDLVHRPKCTSHASNTLPFQEGFLLKSHTRSSAWIHIQSGMHAQASRTELHEPSDAKVEGTTDEESQRTARACVNSKGLLERARLV